MDHKTFLQKFGLARDAGEAFGVTERNISQWKIRGIPARFWPAAQIIAEKRRWGVTALDLANSAPRAGRTPDSQVCESGQPGAGATARIAA